MTINISSITALPVPPQKTDPTNFASRADAFVVALTTFRDELSAAITEMNQITSGLDQQEITAAWDNATTYDFPDVVAGSNGYSYRCLGTDVLNVDPTTDDGSNWLQLYAPESVKRATDFTGGVDGCLDYYDGTELADGDIGFVQKDGVFHPYLLDATSGAAASSPDVIPPATNAGDKRWILQSTIGLSVPAGAILTGNIIGGNYRKTGANQIQVDALSCRDAANLRVIKCAQQYVTIPAAANGLYSLFACSDGTVRTDTDIGGANLADYTIRWIGFVKNNSSGELAAFVQDGNWFSFLVYSETIAMSGISTTPSTIDLSAVLPVARCQNVRLAAHGSSSTTYSLNVYDANGGEIAGIGVNNTQTDTTNVWYYTGGAVLLPVSLLATVKVSGATATLGVHIVEMKR